MKYLLDTRACLQLMAEDGEPARRRLAECQVGDAAISAITYAELQLAAAKSRKRADKRDLGTLTEDVSVLPFSFEAARAFGPMARPTAGLSVDGTLDALIAAHAIALNVVLVTADRRAYAAYSALRVESWGDDHDG